MQKRTIFYRLLEMIPGSLIWMTFIFSIVLSFYRPLWVIYFIIVYYFLWLLRIIYFVFYIFFSFIKYRRTQQTDWFAKVQTFDNWEDYYHIIYLPTAGESVDVLRTTFNSLLNATYPSEKMIVILGGEGRM